MDVGYTYGMTQDERDAMNATIHALVECVDALGLGVDLTEHLGPEQTEALMAGYREHERRTADR